ncbi:lipoyl(octanoyl) transferase LipB [Flammeovirga yaeyamensis]|uniref:Octanoyltransferase n=1 Tax=Flammeovirga yaeyamensis TaxID=367791 RepID=A0AAX1N7I8_9BACT|nr:lipoyl(octanoyl) transferase LipB [Flammeovirga yaeyamensis]MBB3701079.1 lipoyl(octanoyl) transferase [Flammeovirga yaeyamensis]NMF38091.1 lipoyl(octanoyl) transferase LipB [Flammeovirga yaeyamensis]QWG01863.1 lipoyl(octanoyl) transferase LipB [Flammeovirga yaeyamensis]
MMNKKVEFRHLGNMKYAQAWDYQTELFDGIVQTKLENRRRTDRGEEAETTNNYLLFVEHPHVYTLGKSGKEEHLLLDQQGLDREHVEFFKINRGGDITYHGPGQIVGYPILDLDNFFTDIHKYLRLLEEAIILTLADYGIKSGRIDGLTGVWIGEENDPNPRKICAMGVKTSRWVTMHGFALNVNADLKFFGNIVPCGISDKAVTSMEQELGHQLEMSEVEGKLKNHLATLFEMELFENQEN